MKFAFTAKVLRKYEARYEFCDACGFLRAHEPHWLDEAYSKAIAAADTGLLARNFLLADKLAAAIYWAMGERGQGRYLDTAGGYGVLTRLMRDRGFNFYWADKHCENLLAPGYKYRPELGACLAVTAIEVLEHLTDPLAFIADALSTADAQALLFTTQLYAGPPPDPATWWYYTFGTGQHIGFFQSRTLEALGSRLGLSLTTANGIHVLSKKPLSQRGLALATGRLSTRLSSRWIRWQLGSKTVSDHECLLRDTVTGLSEL
jgi:hypothetical protein